MKFQIILIFLCGVLLSHGEELDYTSSIQISRQGFDHILSQMVNKLKVSSELKTSKDVKISYPEDKNVKVKTTILTSESEEAHFEEKGDKEFIFSAKNDDTVFENKLHFKFSNVKAKLEKTEGEECHLDIKDGVFDLLIGFDLKDGHFNLSPISSQLVANIDHDSKSEDIQEKGNKFFKKLLEENGEIVKKAINKFINKRTLDLTTSDDENKVLYIHEIKELKVTKDLIFLKFLNHFDGLEELDIEVFDETTFEHEFSLLKKDEKKEETIDTMDEKKDEEKENDETVHKDFILELKDKNFNDVFKLIKHGEFKPERFIERLEKIVNQLDEKEAKESFSGFKSNYSVQYSMMLKEMDVKIKIMKPKSGKFVKFEDNKVVITLPFEFTMMGESHKMVINLDYDLVKKGTSTILRAKDLSIKSNSPMVSLLSDFDLDLKDFHKYQDVDLNEAMKVGLKNFSIKTDKGTLHLCFNVEPYHQ